MGRTYLSIKLAAAFGLIVGILVGVATAPAERAATPRPGIPAALVEMEAAPVAPAAGTAAGAEAVPCLWRSCPAVLSHPLLPQPRLRAVAPAGEAEITLRLQRAT